MKLNNATINSVNSHKTDTNNNIKPINSFIDVSIEDNNHISATQLLHFEQQLKEIKKNTLFQIHNILTHLNRDGFKLDDIRNVTPNEDDIVLKCKEYNHLRKSLKEIDYALQKIKNNEYGYCEETGEPIDLARLHLIPTARFSVEAQEIMDKTRKRS